MPTIPLVAAVAGIGAVANIAGSAINSHAAKSAAKTQSAAAERAAAYQAQTARDIQANNQQTMSPYMSLGQMGMGLLTNPGSAPAAGPAFAPRMVPMQQMPQTQQMPLPNGIVPTNQPQPRSLASMGMGYWG